MATQYHDTSYKAATPDYTSHAMATLPPPPAYPLGPNTTPDDTSLLVAPGLTGRVRGVDILLSLAGTRREWKTGSRLRVIKYHGLSTLLGVAIAVAIAVGIHYAH